LTIGTLDGANIEIREKAGAENFFLFGLDAAEVKKERKNYQPNEIIAADPEIRRVMELVESGHFNQSEPGIFDILTRGLRDPHDQWLTIADFRSYIDAQKRQEQWSRQSIINVASSGWFSSDRTIGQYADEIWKAKKL